MSTGVVRSGSGNGPKIPYADTMEVKRAVDGRGAVEHARRVTAEAATRIRRMAELRGKNRRREGTGLKTEGVQRQRQATTSNDVV